MGRWGGRDRVEARPQRHGADVHRASGGDAHGLLGGEPLDGDRLHELGTLGRVHLRGRRERE
jgi:hypothetical protein